MIEPVTNLDEKIERLNERRPRPAGSFIPRMFLAHLKGLENFSGKKVLEIGGSNFFNLADFFLNQGADYTNIRLEENDSGFDYVVQGNFMDCHLDNYDLIISSAVFEKDAIERVTGTIRNRWPLPSEDYLARLNALTNSNGVNIHATSTGECLFNNNGIRETGFELLYRDEPFFNFHNKQLDFDEYSELIVMRKLE